MRPIKSARPAATSGTPFIMQLIQYVLRCANPPGAAVHRSTHHHVVHHIGEVARHLIHRIAARTPSGFGSVCRYVAVAVGIGTGAAMPPVAASGLLPPPVPLPVAGDFGPRNSGGPSGVSGAFGGSSGPGAFSPQDITDQALLDPPFQFIVDPPPGTDDPSLDVMAARVPDNLQPIFPSPNIPLIVVSVPPVPPKQTVAEPPAFGLLLTGFLAILWCQRRGFGSKPVGARA
jgi:hypothetical protein